MKFIIFVFCIAFSLADIFVKELFSNWTQTHGKTYTTKEEFSRRFSIFEMNLKWINQRNTELENMTVGLNHFADMTQEEFSAIYLRPINSTIYNARVADIAIPQDPNNVHVGKACQTPVRNQGFCGSCAAFSATGAAEGLLCLPGNGINYGWLSVQELVDCTVIGCVGGWPVNALQYLIQNGMCKDQDYQYVSGRTRVRNRYCYRNLCQIHGIRAVNSCKNGREMAAALNNGNFVSIVIDASGMDFRFYKSGRFMPQVNCAHQNTNHAVLAVAIDGVTKPDVNCKDTHYRVKNSWGSWWGEQGYFWLPAGCNCLGIANHPSVYPVS